MVKKTFENDGGVVKVTFELPPGVDASEVYVVGDFNGWAPTHPLVRANDCWRCTVELELGHEYQFRYLVDGETWLNDPAADKYAPNPFGSENSVVVVVKPGA